MEAETISQERVRGAKMDEEEHNGLNLPEETLT
jgi:hypothetical protein